MTERTQVGIVGAGPAGLVLAARLAAAGLDAYSDRCLARVCRVHDFSTWMTTLLHLDPLGDPFDLRLQRSRQEEVARSRALATNLAENYVGLPL